MFSFLVSIFKLFETVSSKHKSRISILSYSTPPVVTIGTVVCSAAFLVVVVTPEK
jgi:hypothetical protein